MNTHHRRSAGMLFVLVGLVGPAALAAGGNGEALMERSQSNQEQGGAAGSREPQGDNPTSRGHMEQCQYVSSIDGATMYFALWYPPKYDPSESWPLIVFLHGSGEGDHWFAPTHPEASIPVRTVQNKLPFLVVFPLMRGSWSINGPSEVDVLDTIQEVEKRANVDADRIHLTGLSLGGFASWALAAHHPHLFASVSILAGGGQPEWAGNLRNLPIRIYHGTADDRVPIAEAHRMVAALREARVPAEFVAMSGVDHICWREPYASNAFYAWMTPLRREASPKRISYFTRGLRHNRAYWSTIESMVDPALPARIDAFCPDGRQVMVHAENVGRLVLNPPVAEGSSPTFFVNNQPMDAEPSDAGWVLRIDDAPAETLEKKHGLSGPIQDVFFESFVVVTPSQADTKINDAWLQTAQFAFRWTDIMTIENFRFTTDAAVTPEMIASSNLICFGNADDNKIIGQVADRLPVTYAGGRVTVNGQAGIDGVGGLVMIYPNPLNPERYIVTCSGNPRLVAPMAASMLQSPQLAATPHEDLVVFTTEGRLMLQPSPPEAELAPAKAWMAPQPWPRGAVFDRHWQIPESVAAQLMVPPAPPAETPGDNDDAPVEE